MSGENREPAGIQKMAEIQKPLKGQKPAENQKRTEKKNRQKGYLTRRINMRFMILILVAILATVSLSAFVFYELFRKEIMANLQTYAELMMENDAWEIMTNPDQAGVKSADSEVSQLRITLIAPDGTVTFDNNADIGEMGNHSERPEVIAAFATGEGQAIRRSPTLGKNTFYYAVLLDNGYVLRVAKEAGSITSIFIGVFPIIGVICVVLFLLCLLLSRMLTRNIVRPIEELAEDLEGDSSSTYRELQPFVDKIRQQHEDIIHHSDMRQEFTANVSHELKTPLTAISGYSELIESGMAGEQDVVRFAHEIHRSSARLLMLINDIIRLSELDQSDRTAPAVRQKEFGLQNLYEIADNCVNMLEMNAQKHQVSICMKGEPQQVFGNREMLEELVYNLCDNAIRYNNAGGSVQVTVTRQEDRIVLEVKDTGIGIPREHQERIFERFYRVDKSRSKSTGGTGLGLAIVKHIVAIHPDAQLQLESEPGKGTTIRVLFPVPDRQE